MHPLSLSSSLSRPQTSDPHHTSRLTSHHTLVHTQLDLEPWSPSCARTHDPRPTTHKQRATSNRPGPAQLLLLLHAVDISRALVPGPWLDLPCRLLSAVCCLPNGPRACFDERFASPLLSHAQSPFLQSAGIRKPPLSNFPNYPSSFSRLPPLITRLPSLVFRLSSFLPPAASNSSVSHVFLLSLFLSPLVFSPLPFLPPRLLSSSAPLFSSLLLFFSSVYQPACERYEV